MFKQYARRILVTALIILLPVPVGLLLWSSLPAQLPLHFDWNGTPDSYGSRFAAVFGLPLSLLAIHLFCAFFTMLDPKRSRISGKLFSLILWICPALSLVLSAVTFAYGLGWPVNVSLVAYLLVSIVFLAVGNYLPKCRQNYTVGIRLPWTLANEENWNRTHRLGGRCYMVAGVLLLAASPLQQPWLLFPALVLAAGVPTAYSLWLHVKRGL